MYVLPSLPQTGRKRYSQEDAGGHSVTARSSQLAVESKYRCIESTGRGSSSQLAVESKYRDIEPTGRGTLRHSKLAVESKLRCIEPMGRGTFRHSTL